MNDLLEQRHRALRRLLANGPLTGIPRRPSDQELIVILAAARFDAEKTYGEAEVNEVLEAWIATFCEPYAIDHVSLRRMLVDSRLLARTTSGSSYRVDRDKRAELGSMQALDPTAVLAEIRGEREARKQKRASMR